MNCETCSDYLADFLLDELPESQAVLVHEHLNLCPACMRNYKDLKGTGMALQAVTAMRPVEGSPEFEAEVRAKAAAELAKIIERLPPDKRLRLEARRAARQSRIYRPQPPRKPFWSSPLVLIAACGLLLAAIFAAASRKKPPEVRVQVGRLSLTFGEVEQIFQRKGQPHTPAREGAEVLSSEMFLTGASGGARFDMLDGGALFLAPASGVTFRAPVQGTHIPVIVLDSGQLGVQRNFQPGGNFSAGEPWSLRIGGGGSVVISRNAHIYLAAPSAENPGGSLRVLQGSAELLNREGQKVASVSSGQQTALPSSGTPSPRPEPLRDARVPAWRADLITESELSCLFGAAVKAGKRRRDALEILLTYRAEHVRRGSADWAGETGDGLGLGEDAELILPPRARLQNAVRLSAPVSLELVLNSASQPGISVLFGIETEQSGVVAETGAEAVLQVREENRTVCSAAVPMRAQQERGDRLRLDVVLEKTGLTAVLSSASSGKSTSLPLPRGKFGEPCGIWLQAQGEGVLLDEIKLSGTLPVDWLRDRLGKE